MHTLIKWFLVAACSLVFFGGYFNNFNTQWVQNEQINEDALKRDGLKEVDSRTAYEKFSSDFSAYKDMHDKHKTNKLEVIKLA